MLNYTDDKCIEIRDKQIEDLTSRLSAIEEKLKGVDAIE